MKNLFLLLLCSLAMQAAEILPSTNLYTTGWASAGVTGGIPDTSGRTVHATITSTGDSTDRTSAINNAIAACPSGQVVVLGAGTFRVNGTLTINNETGVVVRGTLVDGVKATIIDGRGDPGWVMGNTTADYQLFDGPEITVDAAQGATVLTFATAASFVVGDRVSIHQDNSTIAAWPVVGYMSASTDRGMRHGSKITAKDSTTITIADPLPFAFTTAQNAEVHRVGVTLGGDGFAYQCGIEDLVFDVGVSEPIFGITMWSVDQCWLKNVEVKEAGNYLVYMLKALHCTIQKCYLNAIAGVGNNGSGLLIEQSSMNLVQDNIIRFCQPNIEVNFGCTGNVFAYNALLQSQGDISICANHGAHNAYNLYEGNVAPNLKPDGYFGSVSHDTAARNRFTGADDIGDAHGFATIDLKRFTRYYNVVGNVLGLSTSATYEQTGSGNTGAAIYQLGYPNIGNTTYSGTASPLGADYWTSWPGAGALPTGYQERDLDVSATITRKGNYNTANQAVPAGESVGSDTISNSYYLAAKPTWFYGLTWPPFDPTAAATATYRTNMSLSFAAIPAGYRYLNSGADPEGGGSEGAGTVSTAVLRVGTIRVAP